MYNTLFYIATHLNYYSFESSEARSLKRDIERWSTLPKGEQSEKVEGLLDRFFQMFTNNPYLENHNMTRNGVLLSRREGITARTFEGYFNQNGRPVTLRRKGSQQGDDAAVFLGETGMSDFINQKKLEADQAVADYARVNTEYMASRKKHFSHIIDSTFKDGPATYKNPTPLGVIITLAFYGFFVWALFWPLDIIGRLKRYVDVTYVMGEVGFSKFFLYYGKDMLMRTLLILLVAMFGLIILKGSINMVIKGIYRAFIRHRFNSAEMEFKRVSSLLRSSLAPSVWMTRFSAAAKKDSDMLDKDPERGISGLQTTGMLASRDEAIPAKDLIPEKPWSKYRYPGERQKLFFKIVLAAALILLIKL